MYIYVYSIIPMEKKKCAVPIPMGVSQARECVYHVCVCVYKA